MKFQSNRCSCGPAALHNALSALGVDRTEEELIRLAGQNTNGTSAAGLTKALKSIALEGGISRPTKFRDEEDAVVGLWWWLTERGRPLLLCVDGFEHWVAATGYLGQRFAVCDSADNRLLIYYDGPSLLRRWIGPTGAYHGIIV